MKKSGLITRAAMATGFLAMVAVPATHAISDNVPNYGQSGKTVADPSPAAAGAQGNGNAFGLGNGNGVGRPDSWGGCRGIHGTDNPGQGLSHGLNGGNGVGTGHGNAYGLDKPWKDCGHNPPPPPGPHGDVEGTSYSMPETR